MRAPAAGTYQLSAARIGHEGFGPIPLEVADSGQTRLIVMPTDGENASAASSSPADRVAPARPGMAPPPRRSGRKCAPRSPPTRSPRAKDGSRLRVVRFERDLAPDRVFLRERIIRRHLTTGQPFVAEDPAVLLRRGFVYTLHDSVHYAAPDAALLLRDEFVDAHCFSAREDGPPGATLGLSFTPVPGRTTPDVTGTLWLDAASHELRYLEFQYTGLDREQGLGGPGGRIEFRRLEDGSWIVHDWSLAMPVVGRVRPVGPARRRGRALPPPRLARGRGPRRSRHVA